MDDSGVTGFLCESTATAFSEAMLSFVTPVSPTQQSKLMALLAKTSANSSAISSATASACAINSVTAITNNNTSTKANTNTSPTVTTPASEPDEPHLTLSILMGRLGRAHVQANFTSKNTREMLVTCLNNAMSNSRTSSLPLLSWFFLLLSLLTCFLSYLWYTLTT